MSGKTFQPSVEKRPLKHVGRAVTRTDAVEKVTGMATYAMDMEPGHLLHAKLVTSQVPHARIVGVDLTDAERVPGVVGIVTGDDAPEARRGAFIYDQPVLAKEKVRYVGEPIAIVAAEREEIAEYAASLVEVSYDRLEPVFDLDQAFERDPPAIIHENVRDYEFGTGGDPRYGNRGHVDDEDADRPNLLYKDSKEIGNVARGFDDADHIIDHEYEVRPFQHCSMESRVAIGQADRNGIQIWTSHQVPHNIEKKIGMIFEGLRPSNVTVQAPFVGGGFGGKITDFLEAMVTVIAMAVAPRPVRLRLTRAEEFTTGISRPQVKTRVKDGVTADGRLLARDVEIKFNSGAYNEQAYRCTVAGSDQVYGAYTIPNVRWKSYAIYTNLPKFGAFRGFGKSEINWAIERHMDRTAKKLGLDPVEYRRRNLIHEGDKNAVGDTIGPNDTERCLLEPVERVAATDIDTEFPQYASEEWRIGHGTAFGMKSIAFSAVSTTIKVRRDMDIELQIGAPDIGQGSDTVFAQMVAEEFGVGMDKVTLVTGDTARTPYTRGPTGSRFTYHAGHAIRLAAAKAKHQLCTEAAAGFDDTVSPEEIEIDGELIRFRDEPDRSIHVNELFSTYDQEQGGVSRTMLKRGGELVGSATFDSRTEFTKKACYTPIGQAALVAVNTVTGQTVVLKFCTACDVGRAINPKTVEQQLEGGSAQGIASAIFEEIVFDNGHVVNPNFKDYRVPGPTELPYDMETIIFESMDDGGPYGAKGIGEAGVIPSGPAVGNAIADALDIEPDVLPVTPERVIELVGNRYDSQ